MAEPFPSPYGNNNHNYGSMNNSTDDFLANLLGTGSTRASSRKNSLYFGTHGGSSDNLHSRVNRSRSLTESIANSMIYATNATIRQIQRQRFVSFCIFGCIFMFLFNLIFLPRTSLDRDLRRIHGEILTFDDCSRLFLTHLNFKNNVEKYMDFSQNEMHIPGENYESLEELFKTDFKFHTTTDKYETWVGKPLDNSLSLKNEEGEVVYHANLKESNMLSFHPYSANGSINAPFMFANYGRLEDFEKIKRVKDLSIKNKIVIIRSGLLHTSRKIQNAQENGAIGVIIYPDPYDDGEFTTENGYESFPEGNARHPNAINKETANFVIDQPGDPTTPGWSSTLFSHRVKPETIPKIVSVPVSYESVGPILKMLNENKQSPDFGWKGDLTDFNYSPGPSVGGYTLELSNLVQFKIKPIYNIINEIKGVMKDEEIIIGASRDSIGGMGGATNGHAALLELARGLNELVKLGWKPLRSIKLISWDGSSYGFLGSTEFGEFHANQLNKNAIVYFNLDTINGSKLKIESNPLFHNLLDRVLKQVMFNERKSLHTYFKEMNSTIDLISSGVGDYSVFQNHLGIPSLNIGFQNDPSLDPVPYHNSKYDSLDWFNKIDPRFNYPNLISQFVGLVVLNLSEREMLRIKTYDYFNIVEKKYSKLSKEVPSYWMDRIYDDASSTKLVDQLDHINKLFERLLVKATKFDTSLDALQEEILQDYPWFKLYVKIRTAIKIKVANSKIRSIDRMFLSGLADNSGEGSLKGRKWFKHLIFAPNFTTGEGVELLPGLIESLDDLDYDQFVRNLYLLGESLSKLDAKLLL